MFELFRYINANGKCSYIKEYKNGRQVKISKRRYIKFIKGAQYV